MIYNSFFLKEYFNSSQVICICVQIYIYKMFLRPKSVRDRMNCRAVNFKSNWEIAEDEEYLVKKSIELLDLKNWKS